MRRIHFIVTLAAMLILAASAVQAEVFRAYVSLDGSDADPCTLQQPCRLLPAALAAVQEGGEIWMLDSANYNTGPVAITKGVTILAIPGAVGSVVALGGNAIEVSTASAVTLRNLNVAPFPGNTNRTGIYKQGSGTLLVQDANVFGFTSGNGIVALAGADVAVTRSVIRDNGTGVFGDGSRIAISETLFAGNTGEAVSFLAFSGTATLVATRAVVRGPGWGFSISSPASGATIRFAIVDSSIDCTGSDDAGIALSAVTGGTVQGTVRKTNIAGCDVGAQASGPATVKLLLAGNSITGGVIGVTQSSDAVVESAGDNAIRNNGTPVSGMMTNVGTM